MHIAVKNNNNSSKDYKVGDLFKIALTDVWEQKKTFVYQLINVYDEYMLVRYNDVDGKYHTYNGKYSTIADLFNDLFADNDYIIAHYPKNEYELVLVEKEEEI